MCNASATEKEIAELSQGPSQTHQVAPGQEISPHPTPYPSYSPLKASEAYVYDCQEALFGNKGKEALTYLLVTRNLKIETIKAFRLGFDTQNYAITIPRFDTHGQLNGIKYRHLLDGSPAKYTSVAGSKAAIFNVTSLKDPVVDEVVICEGEFDCLSIYQYASRVPVIAFPGIGTFKDSWLKLLERFKKIYIAFDNEDSANERALELADKLKAYRCYRLMLPEGVKDINELVIKNHANTPQVWQDLLEKAKCLGAPLLKDTVDYEEEAVKAYVSGHDQGVSTGYEKLDQAMGGFAPGRLYIVKGNTKLGKTTFILDLLVNIALKGHKVLIGSFEMKPAQEMIVKIISKLMGRNVQDQPRLSPGEFRKAVQLIQSWGTLSWINRHDHVRLNELYDAVKIKYEEGFRFLLLDHIQFIMDLGSDKEGAVFTQTARVSKFVKKLTNDFPELTIIAITELNNAEGTFGGKSLEYDSDAILSYYGTGLTCEFHRLGSGRYRGKSVSIRWHPQSCSYSVT